MNGMLTIQTVGMMMKRPDEFFKKVIPAILIPIFGLLSAALVFQYALRPEALEKLLNGAQAPYAVLEAYDKWYGELITVSIAGAALMAVCCAAAVFIGRKSAVAVACAVVISLIGILVSVMMPVSEDISGQRAKIREDMAQIENATVVPAEIIFGKEKGDSGLPGISTEEHPAMFTVYSGIGEDTGHGWMNFYIPDSLGFTPDSGKMYDENKSADWNNENAQLYFVTYTTNYNIVTTIEPRD